VKALRLYHETGLLVPSGVDPDTGYRAYSPAQLTDAALIRVLRDVGVSLQDIGVVLDARDVDLVRKVLTEQAERFQAGLDAVDRLVDEIGLDEEPDDSGVVLRRESAHTVLAVDGSPLLADLGPFLLRSERTLREAASSSGAVVEDCFGACYPPPLDDRQEVMAFLPISAPVLVPPELRSVNVRVDELPPGDVAALEHHGSYAELESCYRRLGLWVALHARPAEHPVRERYVTPLAEALANPNAPVTELLWPVVLEDAR
jgi:DNA-binding transcriptional MerR regulator/effector-binding domain-containing protein